MNKTVLYTGPDSSENATLYVLDKTEEIKAYKLGQNVRIGRVGGGKNAEIELNSNITSREHGEILFMGNSYIYTDMNSLNGTFINGVKYGRESEEGKSSVRLQNGDVLRIDQKNLNCTHSDAILMLFLLGDTEKEWATMDLTAQTGDINIGRSSSALAINDEMLSRNHATFVRGAKYWSIRDNGSTNGVFVNNVRLEAPMPLHKFDVVQIANTSFIFLGDRFLYNKQAYSSGEMEIEVNQRREVPRTNENQLKINIEEFAVKNGLYKKKVIIQDIKVDIDTTEMVMVMGGAGAGKTTFFESVLGYQKANKATITLGQYNIYKDYNKVKSKLGYVTQMNLVRMADSVYDTLKDSAKMKLGSLSKGELDSRIDETLNLLGLSREKHSRVGSLSGGQKRRLCVATEHVANPAIFFLDEFDSGLDPASRRALVNNLRTIADDGKIIMVISHSEDEMIDLFDKVIIIAKSTITNTGHLAFYGSPEEAMKFFDVKNMADIIKRINPTDQGGDGKADYYIEQFERLKGGRY